MKQLLFALLVAGQIGTLQERPRVHLPPNRSRIEAGFGGKLLELVNAPSILSLPAVPPKLDGQGLTWSMDVKNLGPSAVTILGIQNFSAEIDAGATIHIVSDGVRYFLKR